MIEIKTDEEIELLRKSNLLLSATLANVAPLMKPGITTLEIDRVAEEYIRDHGGVPGFKGYSGFPNTLCISVNDQVVHGIPSNRVLQEGDIVSVDCGVFMNGFHGDSAYTFAVGEISEELQNLIRVTREALFLGIAKAVAGNRIGDIGHAIQEHAEANRFSVVREMVGHGVGRNLHEEPEVPNYGRPGTGPMLREGMTIAIEPMINLGRRQIYQERDGWTIRTADHKPSAHFEHSIAVRATKADVLSDFEIIDKVLNNN
ncbi:MAG: type I methionyl aminopeptidase [Bacteroidales bacterium]|jgi:methionyl aminopeptidase|nr:type I methionyl aminopeptidase [Bacteroidales bacterium]MDD2570858.1 type I methionyl aminopeptidase [Bacteroidales bacterium]MDD2812178.1 type I methionyl aminopeptidase [Bacteroidales bacterium]MDD3384444.1 type I methionyl aminopeptidase [Bacteroidales bacterium]MDD3810940.1 type I methionyl aminopeptidase [Bacteroidales bacterium]